MLFIVNRAQIMEHRCNCGSAHDTTELGVSYNLYEKIDKDRVECLNEHEEGSGAKVFKTWEERLDRSQVSLLYEIIVL